MNFKVGPQKKTAFQKHKEEEEAKKKRDSEEAAALYETFAASFKADGEDAGIKTFVRGEIIQPGSRPGTGTPTINRSGTKYVPSFLPPSFAQGDRRTSDGGSAPATLAAASAALARPERDRSKPKAIDLVMEEMRKEQEAREARKDGRPSSGFDIPPEPREKGSHDVGDIATTNLYVGNLSPEIDEDWLLELFGRYGPIGSVKVMWPRSPEEIARGRNSGFVAFMRRPDAEAALAGLSGKDYAHHEWRLGWGKAVPLPPTAIYAKGVKIARSDALAPVPAPGDVVIGSPADAAVVHAADTLAYWVEREGCPLEQAVMDSERANPDFRFLFDVASPEHAYYRWRLYSLAQGDTLRRWREEPFIMLQGGPKWWPPSREGRHNDTTGDDGRPVPPPRTVAAGGAAADRERPLSDAQRASLETTLRSLTLERSAIADAMGFALDNAESAPEIADALAQSLCLPETPIPTKVARLFLLSDVLHNAGAPVKNATAYRSLLAPRLPDIFESLGEALRAAGGRITTEALRRHVAAVLGCWAAWFLLGDDVLAGLQSTFTRPAPGGEGTEGRLSAAEDAAEAASLALAPADDLERRCRLSGLSARGGPSAMAVRLVHLKRWRAADDATKTTADDALLSQETAERREREAAIAAAAAAASASASASAARRAAAAGGGAGIGTWADVTDGPVVEPPPAPGSVADRLSKLSAAKERLAVLKAKAGGGVVSAKWDAVAAADASAAAAAAEGGAPAPSPSPAGGGAPGMPPARARIGAEPSDSSSLDRDSDSESDSDSGKKWGKGVASSRGGNGANDAAVDGARRARLRQMEVELMTYRQRLEDGGATDIDVQIATRRAQLMAATEGHPSAGASAAVLPPVASRPDPDRASAGSKRARSRSRSPEHRGRSGHRESDRRRRSPSPPAHRRR